MRFPLPVLPRAFIAVVSAVALAACSSQPSPPATGSDEASSVGHVHGLGVDPADNVVYVATHQGVYRLQEGRLEQVGEGQDTMGFAVMGPNHFVASGHPAPADVNRPLHLGLIESTDAGLNWNAVSLAGQADFHSIEKGVDGLYGYDSLSSTIMKTSDPERPIKKDPSWQPVIRGEVHDLATHPTRPGVFVASTASGQVVRVNGTEEKELPAAKDVILVEWPTTNLLVGTTRNGGVLRSGNAGRTWSKVGQVPGMMEAFQATTEHWLAASSQGIFESIDEGVTWDRIA